MGMFEKRKALQKETGNFPGKRKRDVAVAWKITREVKEMIEDLSIHFTKKDNRMVTMTDVFEMAIEQLAERHLGKSGKGASNTSKK